MSICQKIFSIIFMFICLSAVLLQESQAARRGGRGIKGDMSVGIGLATVGSKQNDLDGVIDDINNANGGNTKNFGQALEGHAQFFFRFSGSSFALGLRPSYFLQSTKGSGTGGDYKYDLSGIAVFPLLRVYPLENDYIKFFMQAGLGYGILNGKIQTPSDTLEFKGDSFGYLGGVGFDFCMTANHCIGVEGNIRYLPIQRNTTSGGTCANASISGISQCGGNTEVERAGSDLQTTMSGIQGIVGYTYLF